MRDPRTQTVGKGLRRRGRLLAEALRPPGGAAVRPRPPARPDREEKGYVAPHAGRLVASPVFLLSPVRSGSTLLRVLLNSHSRIRAPHEMHLRTVHVRMGRDFTPGAMRELELDKEELEHLLWDRVLHLELERSGKSLIVDKTPPNTLIWPRLDRCWPQARYLFLLRHPAAIVSSLVNRRQDPDPAQIHDEVLAYAERLEEARQSLTGLTVRYEELTAEPEKVTREICRHLGVEWEAGMLDYGSRDHGAFRPHIGDWSSNIRSGRIQPARSGATLDGLPPRLARLAETWGYGAGD
ncbi:sulfotransferase [Streptomyces sp. RKND-216]|uniref:sulfotransferase family protein n=1 Tax=Streptomyces sp. RKND-216 TaxID=2562581 RepID=UPI00109DEF7A|nr:sulfotransferase [Streptomyces sp. RKND-216]THA23716.1 sulfotransferase [Streptomyces sp. RKND-216]